MNFLVFLVIFVHNIIQSKGENQEITSEEGYNDYGNGKASNFLSFYQSGINKIPGVLFFLTLSKYLLAFMMQILFALV